MVRSIPRIAALAVSFLGTVVNFAVATQLLTLWHSYKWEAENSEWEWLGDKWRVLGVKVVWILLSSYFASAAAISALGLAGVIKNNASIVRFYRDYFIADFTFCTSFAIVVVYAAFLSAARTGICEEFSRHPELVRDIQEMGMTVENCELWLSRASLALAALLFTLIVIRFHFLLAISNYYATLSSCCRGCCNSHHRDGAASHARAHPHSHARPDGRRIYLLPASPEDASAFEEGIESVYAPVPVNRLSLDLQSQAMEVWVSESLSVLATEQKVQLRKHHHARQRSRSSSVGSKIGGSIFLPIQPGEGLFPTDHDGYAKV